MDIDGNGYQAPGHALRTFRQIVYICSPYSGKTGDNVRAARAYSRYAVTKGCMPIAPHLLFPQFLNDCDPSERSIGLFFGNILMSRCAEVWVFGGVVSSGMEKEISLARRINCPLRYFNEKCEEVRA